MFDMLKKWWSSPRDTNNRGNNRGDLSRVASFRERGPRPSAQSVRLDGQLSEIRVSDPSELDEEEEEQGAQREILIAESM